MVVIRRQLSPAPEYKESTAKGSVDVNIAPTSSPAKEGNEHDEVRHKNLMPSKEADTKTTGERALDSWKVSKLELKWTNPVKFEALIKAFGKLVSDGLIAKGQKKTNVNDMKAVIKKIKGGEAILKTYLLKKFKKGNDKAQYARYGIVKKNRSYSLPGDYDQLALALPIIISAVKVDGFDKEECGEDFWTGLLAEFTTCYDKLKSGGSESTTDVAQKALLRKEVEKHLRAFIYLVRANYPDTWAAELRAWGFEKVRG